MKLELPALPGLKARARVWIALSGGLDSTVLLHLLQEAGAANLRAVHVHHGLQAAADAWVQQVRAQCRALGTPLTVRRVQVDPNHDGGPEAAARDARYAAFRSVLKAGDVLVTAHHRDDQAETVLLRALRGTGIGGLAAMPMLSTFGAGQLWRPLLAYGRAELRAAAEQRGLRWIDDPHNVDPRYARSYLRSEVMPRLTRHWPQANASLARLAQRAADAESLAASLAQIDLQALRQGQGWSIAGLLALDVVRRRNALHHAWTALGWPAPSAARLQRLDDEILQARSDAQPLLRHETGELRRFRDVLYLLPHLPAVPSERLRWPARRRSLQLPDGLGHVELDAVPKIVLSVSFAQGGERLKPLGHDHTRSLKQLCQTAGIPPWVRLRMPLLHADGELLAIAGYWRSAKAAALGLTPKWHTNLAGADGTGFCGLSG